MDRERPERQLMVKVALTGLVLALILAFGSQGVAAADGVSEGRHGGNPGPGSLN